MDTTERTKEFLGRQKHMVIGVVDGDEPWLVPVSIKRHEGKVFEWDSKTDTRHSQALVNNPRIGLVIFQPRDEQEGQFGFYASANAEVVETRDDGFARYRATVTRAWINDESFTKQEVDIA